MKTVRIYYMIRCIDSYLVNVHESCTREEIEEILREDITKKYNCKKLDINLVAIGVKNEDIN